MQIFAESMAARAAEFIAPIGASFCGLTSGTRAVRFVLFRVYGQWRRRIFMLGNRHKKGTLFGTKVRACNTAVCCGIPDCMAQCSGHLDEIFGVVLL